MCRQNFLKSHLILLILKIETNSGTRIVSIIYWNLISIVVMEPSATLTGCGTPIVRRAARL